MASSSKQNHSTAQDVCRAMLRSLALLTVLLLSITPLGDAAAAASPRSLIGVNYGSLFSSTPLAYSVVVDLMQKNGFSKVSGIWFVAGLLFELL